MAIPGDYVGREQAFIKHTILKTYLERLFMIIGQTEAVINYVDCFAGPWSDENEELADTSIGISLNQMRKSITAFENNFNRIVKFRALYVERDKKAFSRLREFLERQENSNIEVECMYGDYTTLIPKILEWTKSHFTFFFIDPKGWKGIIGPAVLDPLLRRPRTEFLINLMYEFANRAASIAKHHEDIAELLGATLVFDKNTTAEERQIMFLAQYRNSINGIYKGRTAYVSIERPGKDRILYFLIYLTRHPKGIIVFKDEAEKMILIQRIAQEETRLRKQLEKTPIMDMFGTDNSPSSYCAVFDNNKSAERFLLSKLSSAPLLIDNECWASFLEESEFYPSDFQIAMKKLVSEKKVRNLSADVSRRRTKIIRPDRSVKSEQWVIVL